MELPVSSEGDQGVSASTPFSSSTFSYGQLWSTELPQLRRLIIELSEAQVDDIVQREVAYESFLKIVDHYQEQPHVIDPYLEELIDALLTKGRKKENTPLLTNQAFTYIYLITKMRGYKVVIRYFPHEVSDLAPILTMLEEQSEKSTLSWQTRYVLLLWLSIVVKIPFDLSRFDVSSSSSSSSSSTTMDRILSVGRTFLWSHDVSREASAFMLSQFLTRPDVKSLRLETFVSWALENIPSSSSNSASFQSAAELASLHGTLTSLALIFKHGGREDVSPFGSRVLRKLIDAGMDEHPVPTVRRLATKIVNRVGLVFLPVRIAAWRYTRGARSLESNLTTNSNTDAGMTALTEKEAEEEMEIPDEVEEIVEFLLTALKDRETVVRWSAAKGVGRVTGRLPREFADQVVGSVLESFSNFEGDGAWHGGCLTLAELGRRGLLLPDRLPEVVPVVVSALVYEDRRGNYALGAHVRDAACYVCWSFARAYDPEVIRPHVNVIAGALLVTTVFDREVNCRRAASAAFQENVGRQGEFPHGIDILTTADYMAVGNRTNSFVNLARFIAQFPEYTKTLLDHLVDAKVAHWDPAIRELTASSLAALTDVAPQYMIQNLLPRLVVMATSKDMETRHGGIFATGEVVLALRNWARDKMLDNGSTTAEIWTPEQLIEVITAETWSKILDIVPKLSAASLFKGLAGEWTRKAACRLIHRLSEAQLPLLRRNGAGEIMVHELGCSSSEVRESWLQVINELLHHGDPLVASSAIDALPHFCSSYLHPATTLSVEAEFSSSSSRSGLIQLYQEVVKNAQQEKSRQGHCLALASLPKFMFLGHLSSVVQTLSDAAFIPAEATMMTTTSKATASIPPTTTPFTTVEWADARRDAISALADIVVKVGFDPIGFIPTAPDALVTPSLFQSICAVALSSLGDYTTDSRGDVGSLVREAGVLALQKLVCFAADASSFSSQSLLTSEFVSSVVAGIVQQACEKINRTRAVAGKAFAAILWHDPEVPHVPEMTRLRAVFTRQICGLRDEVVGNGDDKPTGMTNRIDWSSPSTTFPLFSQLLHLDAYIYPVLLGCVVSVGGLTESLVLHAGETMANFFHEVTEDENLFQRVADATLQVLRSHLKNERVSIPYLKMMEQLVSAGCFERVSDTQIGDRFAVELIDLTKKEVALTKNPQKLMAAAELLCVLLQFSGGEVESLKNLSAAPVGGARKKALTQLAIFLCHRFPRVRKVTAEKLYEALITYDDIFGEEEEEEEEEDRDDEASASKSERVMALLSETQWDSKDVNEVKPIRNELCDLLGIKPPIAVPKKTPS